MIILKLHDLFLTTAILIAISVAFFIYYLLRKSKKCSENLKTKLDVLEKDVYKIEDVIFENIKLSTAIEQSSNSIVITDTYGIIVFVNDAFCNLTGYSKQEAIGQNPRILKTNYLPNEVYSKLWSTISSGKTWHGEFFNRKKNGETYWEKATITPVKNTENQIISYIAVKENITELKQIRTMLDDQNEELKIMNEIMNATNRELAKSLEEVRLLNSTKDKFFSLIAHDLKNPFNSIIGFSDLLLRSDDKFDDAKKSTFIQQINSTAKNTYYLLENLLLWSKSQLSSIQFNPVKSNLSNIILQTTDLVNSSAVKKNINIVTCLPNECIVFIDENMISTVLRNLLTNAVKFTPQNGKIYVSVNEESEYILVSVEDTGIGMSQEQIDNLFSFNKVSSRKGTENETGTGLGLVICKEFIEKHQGVLHISSEPEKGSKFRFSLPTKKPA